MEKWMYNVTWQTTNTIIIKKVNEDLGILISRDSAKVHVNTNVNKIRSREKYSSLTDLSKTTPVESLIISNISTSARVVQAQ